MTIRFIALSTDAVRALQSGGPDAYGAPAERAKCTGPGIPCRHCLKPVGPGADYLILAWRPFPALQPFAETGPIFLCADPCERAVDDGQLPQILTAPDYIVRGYGDNDRIVYGTGAVTPTNSIAAYAQALLAREDVAYVHVRSARNNCYQCRIDG